jgi:hypothetical protein
MNNYRGISVLPPIGKMFEKLLADQIIIHLNNNNLLYNGQYGFRSCHSCESALHEILSDMNRILSERKIGLYFFIDFKKAFDLVPTDILLNSDELSSFVKASMKAAMLKPILS